MAERTMTTKEVIVKGTKGKERKMSGGTKNVNN
jgi:hypothetical protein